MGDAAVLHFLQQKGIATYPTKEACIAAAIDMPTLLSWGDEDMKVFFEMYSIPKGPQLVRFQRPRADALSPKGSPWLSHTYIGFTRTH
eukprot:SAG11_NODE_749_length_7363_cov_12.270099_4_plen_88_part_00